MRSTSTRFTVYSIHGVLNLFFSFPSFPSPPFPNISLSSGESLQQLYSARTRLIRLVTRGRSRKAFPTATTTGYLDNLTPTRSALGRGIRHASSNSACITDMRQATNISGRCLSGHRQRRTILTRHKSHGELSSSLCGFSKLFLNPPHFPLQVFSYLLNLASTNLQLT